MKTTDIADKRIRKRGHVEFHFFDEVYRVYLVVMISPPKIIKKFLEDIELHDIETLLLDTSSGYTIVVNSDTCKGESNLTVIWMHEWNLPCLVHELTHLTMLTFDEKGVPIRVENQETFAYYIEQWFKRITEVYNSSNRKHDKLKLQSKEKN